MDLVPELDRGSATLEGCSCYLYNISSHGSLRIDDDVETTHFTDIVLTGLLWMFYGARA